MLFVCFLFFLKLNSIFALGLVEVFKWKQLDYDISLNSSVVAYDFIFPDAVPSMGYIPYSSVPMGVNHHKEKLFITTPRRRPGIPSTLNYIDISASNLIKSPKLRPYPAVSVNRLHSPVRADPEKLISVYRTRTDSCERLWFIDTGMLEYPNNRTQIQRPSIWVIDLLTNKKIRRFEIAENVVPTGRGLASITVDVDSYNCNDAYAYIPDLVHSTLHVYSFRQNRLWSFQHNYFNFDPISGDLNIAGQSFQWNDGIFSITLGNKNKYGFRTAFFHPMASTSEFAVSTQILRNETNALRSNHGNDFQILGVRGANKQSTMHGFDPKTGVILYAEIAQYGVGCWNTNKNFSIENHGIVQQNRETMIYPSDLNIDAESVVWVMTNSMPIFIYSMLDTNEYNFRVWKRDVQKAVEGSVCE